MSSFWIWVKPDKDHHIPGEELNCTVHWNLKQTPEEISVSLYWRPVMMNDGGPLLRGAGFKAEVEGDVESEQIQTFHPGSSAGTHQMRFALPDGPYSHRGKVLMIVWRLKVTANGSDLGAAELSFAADVQISPNSASSH